MSSAYMFNLKSWPPILMPVMSVFSRMAHASGSRAKTKISGLRGQPCLVPR